MTANHNCRGDQVLGSQGGSLLQNGYLTRSNSSRFLLESLLAALAILAEAEQFAREYQFCYWAGPIATVRTEIYPREGNLAAAMAALEPPRRQAEARAWHHESLRALLLQA